MKRENKIMLFTAISTFVLLIALDSVKLKYNSKIESNRINDTIKKDEIKAVSDLNQKSVYDMICIAGIEHPKVVLAQAILETGHFTSNVLKSNNNLFGFHNGAHYLKFKTIFDSCKFYREWQKQHYWQGDYYVFLDEYGYAKDSNYVEILKKIKINV